MRDATSTRPMGRRRNPTSIDGKHKLVVGQGKRKDKPADRLQLFDIYADPAEKTNLADQLPDVVQRMQAALDDWRRACASYDGRDYAPERSKE